MQARSSQQRDSYKDEFLTTGIGNHGKIERLEDYATQPYFWLVIQTFCTVFSINDVRQVDLKGLGLELVFLPAFGMKTSFAQPDAFSMFSKALLSLPMDNNGFQPWIIDQIIDYSDHCLAINIWQKKKLNILVPDQKPLGDYKYYDPEWM